MYYYDVNGNLVVGYLRCSKLASQESVSAISSQVNSNSDSVTSTSIDQQTLAIPTKPRKRKVSHIKTTTIHDNTIISDSNDNYNNNNNNKNSYLALQSLQHYMPSTPSHPHSIFIPVANAATNYDESLLNLNQIIRPSSPTVSGSSTMTMTGTLVSNSFLSNPTTTNNYTTTIPTNTTNSTTIPTTTITTTTTNNYTTTITTPTTLDQGEDVGNTNKVEVDEEYLCSIIRHEDIVIVNDSFVIVNNNRHHHDSNNMIDSE